MSPAVAAVVLAAFPSPDRGVWYLGPIPIRAYALCIIVGIVVAVLWGERRFVARGGEAGIVTDVATFAVPFGLVGGRLYHVATDWQTYFGPGGNPIDALKIWQGGLGIWGAVALGAVGAWIGCRRRGVPLPFFADAVAPCIITAQAIGRLGNWFNQELYGGPTTLPWGLEIYRRVDPDTGAPDTLGGVALDPTPIEIVHPTFLYELLWNLLVAALVVWADRRFRLGHGRAFAVYVAGYTAGRFWIEQMRTDYATRVFGDLRINVVVSVVVFAGAVLYLALVRKPREVMAPPDAAEAGELVAAVPGGAGATMAGESAPVRSAAVGLVKGPVVAPPPAEAAADAVPGESAVTDDPPASTTAAEAPVAEAPVVEPVAVENPVAEPVAVENPAVENRAAEAPAADSPAADSPAADSPAAEPAAAESPAVEAPVDETPASEASDAEPPAVDLTKSPDEDRERAVAEPGEHRP